MQLCPAKVKNHVRLTFRQTIKIGLTHSELNDFKFHNQPQDFGKGGFEGRTIYPLYFKE